MNILSIVTKPQRRGAELFAAGLNQELRRLGHSARLVTLYEHRSCYPIGTEDLTLDFDESSVSERLPGFNVRLLARLIAIAREVQPEIIQLNGSRAVKYGALMRWVEPKAHWALVYRSIGIASDWHRSAARRWLYARVVARRWDGVVAVSQASLGALRRCYGSLPLTVCIPRAVDPATLVPSESRETTRRRLGTHDDDSVVLYVGSLSQEKRLDRLLRVAALAHGRGTRLEVWIVGDGPQRAGLERSLGGEGFRVLFLGVQTDVATYMAAADLLLLTSDTEGFPGVVLEAACVRLPSVATLVGGAGEAIVAEETGLLVPPEDEVACAAAVSRLLGDPQLRRDMGEAARRRARRDFTLASVAAQYVEFYRRVAAARKEQLGGRPPSDS